jgi:hypothetical protein
MTLAESYQRTAPEMQGGGNINTAVMFCDPSTLPKRLTVGQSQALQPITHHFLAMMLFLSNSDVQHHYILV